MGAVLDYQRDTRAQYVSLRGFSLDNIRCFLPVGAHFVSINLFNEHIIIAQALFFFIEKL